MAEFDVEVILPVSFKGWDAESKLALIKEIIEDGEWEFEGETTVEIEPPDFP